LSSATIAGSEGTMSPGRVSIGRVTRSKTPDEAQADIQKIQQLKNRKRVLEGKYSSAQEVGIAFQSGLLTREQATTILKNQFQIESTAFFNGLNLKTAYTPINHLAIQANGQYSQEFDQPNPNRKYHKYLEGAIGTYYCFKNNSVIELYAGYGQGASIFGDPIVSNEMLLVWAKGHYEKYYAQINFGSHKLVDHGLIGVSIRAGNIRYSYTDANFNWLINTTADHYSLEPYFFINKLYTLFF
jgi:hypothetical protein